MLHDLLLFLFNTSPCFLALARYKLYRRLSLARGWICLLSYSSRPVLRSVQVREKSRRYSSKCDQIIWKSCGIGIIWKSCGIIYETMWWNQLGTSSSSKRFWQRSPSNSIVIPFCRALSILSFRVIACQEFVQKLNQTSQEKLWALNRSA